MSLKNLVEIETQWGFKAFELHCADITSLDFSVDLLAISAFKGDYEPTPGSIIGALQEKLNISVEELYQNCELNLRESLDCWVSGPLPVSKFKHLICIEIMDLFSNQRADIHKIFQNLFIVIAIMHMKGIHVSSIALPLLGTEMMRLDPKTVIRELLKVALDFMQGYQFLKRVVFVERTSEKAAMLDEEMNNILGRVKVILPKGKLIENIKKESIRKLDNNSVLLQKLNPHLFTDLTRIISSDDARSFELGIVARRLVEFIVDDFLATTKGSDLKLNQKIVKGDILY